jgi:hypothetical protein
VAEAKEAVLEHMDELRLRRDQAKLLQQYSNRHGGNSSIADMVNKPLYAGAKSEWKQQNSPEKTNSEYRAAIMNAPKRD